MLTKVLLLHLSFVFLSPFALRRSLTSLAGWLESYFLGMAVQVFAVYVLLLAAIPLSISTCLAIFVALLRAAVFALRSIGRCRECCRFPRLWPCTWRECFNLLLALTLIPGFAVVLVRLVLIPDLAFDSGAIWGVKAKYLLEPGGVWSEAFFDSRRLHAHPGYPLFWPIFLAQHYALAAEINEAWSRLGLGLFFVCSYLTLLFSFRTHLGTFCALALLGVLLYLPALSCDAGYGGPCTGYADFPLAVFFVLSLVSASKFCAHGTRRDLLASAIFLSAAMLIKDEGVVWAVLTLGMLLALVFFLREGFVLLRRDLALTLLCPVFVAVVWIVLRVQLPGSSDVYWPVLLSQGLEVLGSLPLVSYQVLSAPAHAYFNIILVLLGGSIFLLWGKRELALFAPILGQLLAYLLVLSVLQVQHGTLEYYLEVTVNRLILHILYPSVFVIVLGLGVSLRDLNQTAKL